MVTATATKYVRLNGTAGSGGISFGSARWVPRGGIFKIDDTNRVSVEGFLASRDASRQAYFSEVDERFAESLPKCRSCNVILPDTFTQKAHRREHEQHERNDERFARLRSLEQRVAKTKEEGRALKARLQADQEALAALTAEIGASRILFDLVAPGGDSEDGDAALA
jgi:hypothetical protein